MGTLDGGAVKLFGQCSEILTALIYKIGVPKHKKVNMLKVPQKSMCSSQVNVFQ